MRRLLLSILLLFPLVLAAQNSISVLGVPLGGELSLFVNTLKSKGFKVLDLNEPYHNATTIYMSGTFYGMGNTRVDILQDNDLKKVTVVNVRFDKKQYNESKIKEMVSYLDNDYGKHEYTQSSSSLESSKTWTWKIGEVPITLTIKKNGEYPEDLFCGRLHVSDISFLKKIQMEEDAEIRSHIMFMGHYISEPNFVKNLLKDCKIWKTDEGDYIGDFGGYRSTFSFKPYDWSSHIVAIQISKPKYELWINLKQTYYDYKNLFSKKYKLVSHIEDTGIPYNSSLSESDFALHNILVGDGKFSCTFEIPNGMIIMSINPKKDNDYPEYGEVVITYIDNKYLQEYLKRKEKEELSDI